MENRFTRSHAAVAALDHHAERQRRMQMSEAAAMAGLKPKASAGAAPPPVPMDDDVQADDAVCASEGMDCAECGGTLTHRKMDDDAGLDENVGDAATLEDLAFSVRCSGCQRAFRFSGTDMPGNCPRCRHPLTNRDVSRTKRQERALADATKRAVRSMWPVEGDPVL